MHLYNTYCSEPRCTHRYITLQSHWHLPNKLNIFGFRNWHWCLPYIASDKKAWKILVLRDLIIPRESYIFTGLFTNDWPKLIFTVNISCLSCIYELVFHISVLGSDSAWLPMKIGSKYVVLQQFIAMPLPKFCDDGLPKSPLTQCRIRKDNFFDWITSECSIIQHLSNHVQWTSLIFISISWIKVLSDSKAFISFKRCFFPFQIMTTFYESKQH